MIVVRAPLRISLGGGGTDVPSYYERRGGGFLIAAAIRQYIFITLNQSFTPDLQVKYSKYERVSDLAELEHPLIRVALEQFGIKPEYLEVGSQADIPSGTGLGSSGTFGVALLQALSEYLHLNRSPREIAEAACDLEINKLQEPSGKQDQYASAFGGLNAYTFAEDGTVTVEPLRLSPDKLYNFKDSLLMYFSGFTRRSTTILAEQKAKSESNDQEMLKNLDAVKQIGHQSRDALVSGDIEAYGRLMHEHWMHKKQRSTGMANADIDQAYEFAKANGAYGGKVIGAGGGGFLLFVSENRGRTRAAMSKLGLREVPIEFDDVGVHTLYR